MSSYFWDVSGDIGFAWFHTCLTTSEASNPEVSSLVNGHSVRKPLEAVFVETEELAPVADVAALDVKVKDVDAVGQGVDVVHQSVVSGPELTATYFWQFIHRMSIHAQPNMLENKLQRIFN